MNGEIKEHIFKIKRNFIDSRERTLIVSPDSISFESGVVGRDIQIVFTKDQIKDLRYGIIRSNVCFLKFQLFIRNNAGQVLEISFSSFSFGAKRDLNIKTFRSIIKIIWKYYFSDYVKYLFSKIKEGERVEICDVVFEKEKIILISQGIIKPTRHELLLNETTMKVYKTHFVLYSTMHPADINKRFTYVEDWNAVLLYSLFDMLKK